MPWLYPPKEKAALVDVAKLAVALRAGTVAQSFLDEGFPETALGNVGRVLLMSTTDLDLPASPRKFALARGTAQLCLAEIVPGPAGEAEARAHLDAVARQRAKSEGRKVIGWLIAERFSDEARDLLKEAGALGSSTAATFVE